MGIKNRGKKAASKISLRWQKTILATAESNISANLKPTAKNALVCESVPLGVFI
jgi:hypothetical protein